MDVPASAATAGVRASRIVIRGHCPRNIRRRSISDFQSVRNRSLR